MRRWCCPCCGAEWVRVRADGAWAWVQAVALAVGRRLDRLERLLERRER